MSEFVSGSQSEVLFEAERTAHFWPIVLLKILGCSICNDSSGGILLQKVKIMELSAVKTDDGDAGSGDQDSSTNEMASPSHTNRHQRALQVWDDLTEFLLADERHLDVFKCGICGDIMLDVTVVMKCHHGFCAQCINNHVDGSHKCPECLAELGNNPHEYLRFDDVITNLLNYALQYHLLRNLLPPPPPKLNTTMKGMKGLMSRFEANSVCNKVFCTLFSLC